jgi:hypothetical protein
VHSLSIHRTELQRDFCFVNLSRQFNFIFTNNRVFVQRENRTALNIEDLSFVVSVQNMDLYNKVSRSISNSKGVFTLIGPVIIRIIMFLLISPSVLVQRHC